MNELVVDSGDVQAVVALAEKVTALIPAIARQMVADTERVVALERAGRIEEAWIIALPWVRAIDRASRARL